MSESLADQLLGHWPLTDDGRDVSGHGRHAAGEVRFTADGAAFDGQGGWLEVPAGAVEVGRDDFSISAWFRCDPNVPDVLGNLVSQWDPARRTGFDLGVTDNLGVTTGQANYRHLQFSLDAGTDPVWQKCGRPGRAVMVFALTVHQSRLYAATFEHGEGQVGHVWRYCGEEVWEDLKLPTTANCVPSMAVCDGHLYASSGCYDSRGSAIGEAGNVDPTSRIWRLEADGSWTDCGSPPPGDDMAILGVYRGRLYHVPYYLGGLYRYQGGRDWAPCADPEPRFIALAQWRGHLYAASNKGRRRVAADGTIESVALPTADSVYRYDDTADAWTGCGLIGGETQMYGFAVYEGELYCGTWPSGLVCRSATGIGWHATGRIHPEEKEVMALAVYNGKLYAGTLPAADVYRYDGDEQWTWVGAVDHTPDVVYRRAWSMAVHDGRLYVGTLPSGTVHALSVGQVAGDGWTLDAGWHHVAAIRRGQRIELHLDGELRAAHDGQTVLDLKNGQPLRIGRGTQDVFHGTIADLRLHARALAAEEVIALWASANPR